MHPHRESRGDRSFTEEGESLGETSAIRRADAAVQLPKPAPLPRESAALIAASARIEIRDAAALRGAEVLPSVPAPPLEKVARFGKYEVLGRIAVGGMAEIFLAHEALPGGALRQTALKIIKQAPASEADTRYFEELFLREGRTIVQLAHPHICHVYDIGRHGEQFFLAMEWIDGRSLRDVLASLSARGQLLEPAVAVGVAAQVASALEYAHTARDARGKRLHVVHRDVNPQNIMLRYDGAVKLVDFGVAQVSAEVDSRESSVKGKPSYMAPEQMLGSSVDGRTDVFALGVCLYEMLTGLRLHKRATLRGTMQAVLHDPVPPLRSFAPDVSEELEAIVRRALEKRPEDRYPTAGALQAALEGYLAREGEVGSARRVGELMRSLYPEGNAQLRIDKSLEANACFHALCAESVRVPAWRSNARRFGWFAAVTLVLVVAMIAYGALKTSPEAQVKPARSVATDATHSPAGKAKAAAPLAPVNSAADPSSTAKTNMDRSHVAPAGPKEAAQGSAPSARPKPLEETPRESVRPRRRRSSPGFVADPGF